MAKRKQYITDEEIAAIEHAIFNNLPSPLLQGLSEGDSNFDERWLKRALEKGEKYARLTYKYINGDYEHVAVTSYGRTINTKSKRLIKPVITVHQLLVRVAQQKVPFEQIFEDNGWENDINVLRKRYIKKGWPAKIHPY